MRRLALKWLVILLCTLAAAPAMAQDGRGYVPTTMAVSGAQTDGAELLDPHSHAPVF